MSHFGTRSILTLAFYALLQTTVFAGCWVIEPKGCQAPNQECSIHECEQDGPYKFCTVDTGTFSNLGSYQASRSAVTQNDINMGGTEVEPDYGSYIYCIQGIPCDTVYPCMGDYCEDDGVIGNFGGLTFDDKFGPNSEACEGAM